MPHATTYLKDRIAVVFDFDLTLGEDSFRVLLRKLDVDSEAFRTDRVEPLDRAGWDHLLARFKALVDLSDERGGAITESLLAEVGRDTRLYGGVPELFGRLRGAADAIAPDVGVEFYVLTAGFAEVPSATPIAGEFERIWGSAGHYGEGGRLGFPKRVVTYPEKVRYLLALAKGLDEGGADSPSDVYRDVPEEEWHVPFDQMIYVGDGSSDLPAFSLMADRGGIAIGVVGPHDEVSGWSEDLEVHVGRRVQNLARADFSEDSELLRSLTLAVEAVAKLVALRRLGRGE